jgi:hypothetical protein
MYIEDKSGGLTGPCRIGRVRFSKTGATLHYAGRAFQSLKGVGFKANYFDVETGAEFWISGPRRDGADGLYGRITGPDDVDEDVAEAYWRDIRGRKAPPNSSARREATVFELKKSGNSLTNHGRKQSRIAKVVNRLAEKGGSPAE